MKCPVCNVELRMADRQGVEIDYCPQCRGVWLDRGEIDKIIEREMAYSAPARQSPPPQSAPPQQPWRDRDYDDDRRHGHYHKKKRGFLGDFLDFD